MAVNKVEICGLDTSKLPMMTYERSTELLKKISEGDEAARDIFIKENLRLVLSVIQRFSGRGEQNCVAEGRLSSFRHSIWPLRFRRIPHC